MATASQQRQRTELTIQEKLEIIKSLKNKRHSSEDLQDIYKVSRHTINRILSNEDQLRNTKNSKMRRIRRGNNKLIDDAVSKWYHSMQQQNVLVNGPLLRAQAVRFARMMGNHTFEANNGWLWRWQQKENVKFNTSRRTIEINKAVKGELDILSAGNKSVQSSYGDCKPSGSWQQMVDHYGGGENASVHSFGDSNASGNWQTQQEPEGENGLEHSEIDVKHESNDSQRNPFEADVVFEVDSEEHDNCDNEDSQNTNYHLGLNMDPDEKKIISQVTTTFRCFVCKKTGDLVPFNDQSFERCLKSIKFRRMKRLKYGEIILNHDARFNLGYHKTCYASVIQMKQHWREEYESMTAEIKLLDNEDEASMDHESHEEKNMQHQSFEVKNEPILNGYRTNDSEDESEKLHLPKKRKIGISNDKEERDIYSIYGDYIARRLRASASEREICEIYTAQHDIDDIIFKLSMGSYARNTESYQNKKTDENKQNQAPNLITREQAFSSKEVSSEKTNSFPNSRSESAVSK